MRRINRLTICLVLLLATTALPAAVSKSAPPLSVAVATNFQPIVALVADSFFIRTGNRVIITAASTGNLLSQLLNGGPYDLFMAADTASVYTLGTRGLLQPGSVYTYAYGTLAAVSTVIDGSVPFTDALMKADRIGLAQPEMAPYGKAAREVLEKTGTWESLRPRCVFAQSVGACCHFARSGNVTVAFVAQSSLSAPDVHFKGVWDIDTTLYAPIEQRLAILAASSNKTIALRFVEFLRAPSNTRLIQSFGYGTAAEVW